MSRGTSFIPTQRKAITSAPAVSGGTPSQMYAAQALRAVAQEIDRYKRESIQPLVDQQAQREAQDDVASGEVRDVSAATRYGRQYQQSANIALTTKIEADARAEAQALYQTSQGDVQAFQDNYNKWVEQTASQYPPGMARTVIDVADAAGRGVVEKITTENFEQTRQEAVDGIRLAQTEARKRVIAAARDGQYDEMQAAFQEYTDATKVRAGYWGEIYSDDRAAVDLESLQFDLLVTTSGPEIDEAYANGGPLAARVAALAMVDAAQGLTPEQATTYKARLDERVNNLMGIANEIQRQKNEKQRIENEALEAAQDEKIIEATSLWAQDQLSQTWLSENAELLGPSEFKYWTRQLAGEAEQGVEVPSATKRSMYVDRVFATFEGNPSENLRRAAEDYRLNIIDKTMFNTIRSLEASAADDRVRDVTRFVKAQFGNDGSAFGSLGQSDQDKEVSAGIVLDVSEYASSNPDATRDDLMNFAIKRIGSTHRSDRLQRSLPQMPVTNIRPKTLADIERHADEIARRYEELTPQELVRSRQIERRWRTYLDLPEPTGGQ